jgi:hypothetical protein
MNFCRVWSSPHFVAAVAQLRTRFCHARFLIHRPFVYKALHYPKLMVAVDWGKCAVAIEAACFWLLSLTPPNNRKHFMPHIFSWIQNFLALILSLQMCHNDEILSSVCGRSGMTQSNIEDAIRSMLVWLEDIRQVDGSAGWSLEVIRAFLTT